jgi:hypothetical protein
MYRQQQHRQVEHHLMQHQQLQQEQLESGPSCGWECFSMHGSATATLLNAAAAPQQHQLTAGWQLDNATVSSGAAQAAAGAAGAGQQQLVAAAAHSNCSSIIISSSSSLIVSCEDGGGWGCAYTTQLGGGAVESRSAVPVGNGPTTAGCRGQQQATMGRSGAVARPQSSSTQLH